MQTEASGNRCEVNEAASPVNGAAASFSCAAAATAPLSSATEPQAVPVNKIINISTVDGPGARTSVFLQACNLRCLYCHNPETQQLCRHCGLCVPGCPTQALSIAPSGQVLWQADACIDCDQCIHICPYNASPRVLWLTAQQLYEKIKPNFPFIRGLTVSGGEATLYPSFVQQIFSLVKAQNKTTLIDANGYLNLRSQPALMAVTDGVMLDLKAWSTDVFKRLTLVESSGHLADNIVYLAQTGKLEELRLVHVDDYVDSETCLREAAALIPEYLEQIKLKLITFRRNGVRGLLSDYPSPSPQTMAQLAELARELGFKRIVIR